MSSRSWIEKETELQKKFDNIKINYEPCSTLSVTVHRGRNISVGFFHDLIDTPDPQVYVSCEAAVGRKNFKTQIAKNSKNPEWNETFTFVLSEEPPVVNIDVYDEDKFMFDPFLGNGQIDANDMEFGETRLSTIQLTGHGEVDVSLKKEWRTESDFRLSIGLCEGEKKFRTIRKPKTMEALQKFLGKDGPTSLEETPTVSLAISGGGYRAVATACGAIEALTETELFDSLMYMAGLSGASWYISSSYLHRSFDSLQSIIGHHDWLRKQMEPNLGRYLFDLSFHSRYRAYKAYKESRNQPTTFVDFYGLALGETLLGQDFLNLPPSSLRDYVLSGSVPYPLLTCAHVRDHLPMSEFWDEVEMSPFEVSIPAYGINMATEHFDSRWRNGVLLQKLPEPRLHFLMATSGSAFAIMWTKLQQKSEIGTGLVEYIADLQKHHEGKADGEDNASTESDSDTDDDMEARTDIKRLRTDEKNFADEDDDWLEELSKRSSTANENEMINLEEGFNSRGIVLQRTAKVKNCAAGYQSLSKYGLNGLLTETNDEASKRLRRNMSTKKREISLCDAALGCNLPSIHVIRPQRSVDVLIIVDCSNYGEKDKLILQLFATVAKQAFDHGIKLPRISLEEIMNDPFRELYIFEDEEDPECPVVLWFTLANAKFRSLENPHRRPGYPHDDLGKEKFNDFTIFPDTSDYGTLRLSFTPLIFDRLRELMRFNIMDNISIVKEKIASKVEQMRKQNK